MTEARTCEECGAGLPTNAPEGLCLRCLAAMGLLVTEEKPDSGAGRQVSEERKTLVERRVRYFGDYELLEEIARGGMGIMRGGIAHQRARGALLALSCG